MHSRRFQAGGHDGPPPFLFANPLGPSQGNFLITMTVPQKIPFNIETPPQSPDDGLGKDKEALSVSEIARTSGQSRFSVYRVMKTVRPDRKLMREGNLADCYNIRSLPDELRAKVDSVEEYGFPALRCLQQSWKDPFYPTAIERAQLFDTAFLWLRDLVKEGMRESTVIGLQIDWLSRHVAQPSTRKEAIKRCYYRMLSRWRSGNEKMAALVDGRRATSATVRARRAPELPKDDFDRLVFCAVAEHEGRLFPAWRKCWPSLSDPTRNRYPLGRKVPNRVAKQVMPEIKRLLPQHIRPKWARLNGCYVSRDWSGTYAGDMFSSDDVTLPVYFYLTLQPRNLTRGQFLLTIDIRSEKVLEFVLEAARGYTQETIRCLIGLTCEKYGVPRKGLHFESGIWKRSKMVSAGARVDPWEDIRESFADRLGIRIVNAIPGNARAKVIERVIGILESMMAGEPGYVGRNEMTTKYERVQAAKLDVASGRLHPSEAGFRTFEEWTMRLTEICEEYNSTPRKSEVTGFYISPDQAWEQLQPRTPAGEVEGMVFVPPSMKHLLFGHKELKKVTRAGITFGKHRYASDVTGSLVGQSVYAWFNVDDPSAIVITDLKGDRVESVPLLPRTAAFGAFTPEDTVGRQALRLVSAHNGYAPRRYSELKAKYLAPPRHLLVDPGDRQRGIDMEERRKEEAKRVKDAARRADQPLSRSVIDDPCYDDDDFVNRTPDEWAEEFKRRRERGVKVIPADVEHRLRAITPPGKEPDLSLLESFLTEGK